MEVSPLSDLTIPRDKTRREEFGSAQLRIEITTITAWPEVGHIGMDSSLSR
jgi:hypothetical protein